jgi:hypothetical protein
MEHNSNIEKAKAEAMRKARIFAEVFQGSEGKKVLDMLDKEFNPDILFNVDQNITNYNLGRRDVLVYIRQMVNYSEREND